MSTVIYDQSWSVSTIIYVSVLIYRSVDLGSTLGKQSVATCTSWNSSPDLDGIVMSYFQGMNLKYIDSVYGIPLYNWDIV